jgi:DNA replication and repair protein RecF
MLNSIELLNFKSHKEGKFDFNGDSFAIVGPNASGKTNVLEAIYFSFLAKPFDGTQADMINRGNEFTKVIADFVADKKNTIDQRIKRTGTVTSRVIMINQNKLKSSDVIGLQPIVVFVPDDVSIITEGPSNRRKFLNNMIIQTSTTYLRAISRYQKILIQRNRLLNGIKHNRSVNKDQLFVYNMQMALPVEEIYRHRYETIQYLNDILSDKYSKISGHKDKVNIEYLPTLPTDKDNIIKELEKNTDLDMKIGFTSRGPHKDDFIIYLNGYSVRSGFSRGENRSLTLSLKVAELDYIKKNTRQSPILLLDDVMSELDTKRQAKLLDIAKKQQTIITSTHLESPIKKFNIIKL